MTIWTVRIAAITACLLAAAAADARAATVSAGQHRVRYAGDPAPNVLSITQSGRSLLVRDAGQELQARDGCVAVDAHTARCKVRDRLPAALVELGAGEDRAALDFPNGLVHVAGGPGADVLDASALGNVTLLGGAGDDVLQGGAADDRHSDRDRRYGGRDDNRLFGERGRDRLVAGDHGDKLDGGAGSDRLEGGAGDDWIEVDARDRHIGAGGGDDWIDGYGDDLPRHGIACGGGTDLVWTDLHGARPGPLLAPACERMNNFHAHPVRSDPGGLTFRLRCQEGEFEYDDHRCRARLRISRGGRVLARSPRFSALNERAVLVRVPMTRALARAAGRRVALELRGFEHWESDTEEWDDVGHFAWRIALKR
jgi:hypothetical protein